MEYISLPDHCREKLESCRTLPSPPKVALQIIQLVKNPEIEIEDVVRTLTLDPALSVKVLRLANSPLYSHEKKVANLQKAVMLIGLNGILSLALSFSLVKSLRVENDGGLDHNKLWRRALISGSAGLALAQLCNRSDQEELFMASFIQDIGMLVLDEIEPSLYAGTEVESMSHHKISTLEQERFGASHAMVGSWLLKQWNFPDRLLAAVRFSDGLEEAPASIEDRQFLQCVAYSGTFADLSVSPISDDELFEISQAIEEALALPTLGFLEVFNKIKDLVRESAPLFEIDYGDEFDPERLMERAKELRALRGVMVEQKIHSLVADI